MKTIKITVGNRHGIEVSEKTANKFKAMKYSNGFASCFSRSYWPLNTEIKRLVSPLCRI